MPTQARRRWRVRRLVPASGAAAAARREGERHAEPLRLRTLTFTPHVHRQVRRVLLAGLPAKLRVERVVTRRQATAPLHQSDVAQRRPRQAPQQTGGVVRRKVFGIPSEHVLEECGQIVEFAHGGQRERVDAVVVCARRVRPRHQGRPPRPGCRGRRDGLTFRGGRRGKVRPGSLVTIDEGQVLGSRRLAPRSDGRPVAGVGSRNKTPTRPADTEYIGDADPQDPTRLRSAVARGSVQHPVTERQWVLEDHRHGVRIRQTTDRPDESRREGCQQILPARAGRPHRPQAARSANADQREGFAWVGSRIRGTEQGIGLRLPTFTIVVMSDGVGYGVTAGTDVSRDRAAGPSSARSGEDPGGVVSTRILDGWRTVGSRCCGTSADHRRRRPVLLVLRGHPAPPHRTPCLRPHRGRGARRSAGLPPAAPASDASHWRRRRSLTLGTPR